MIHTSVLYCGDNLDVLKNSLPERSVDLVYLDPPFATNRLHSLNIQDSLGEEIEAQVVAFEDRWEWNASAKEAYKRLSESGGEELHASLAGLRTILNSNGMLAYLVSVSERLLYLKQAMKPMGSLYLHCDRRTAHYFRIVCDAIFGPANFRNEIIWHYTGGGRSKQYFSRKHDNILFYTISEDYTFNIDAIREPYSKNSGYARSGITAASGKKYMPHPDGRPADDVWDIPMVNPMAKERTGYPTQKPLALLERIISASSSEGDIVLDPYCGSGTTLIAAQKLGRQWVGIDNSELAITAARHRIIRKFPELKFEVVGRAIDLKRALELLDENDKSEEMLEKVSDKELSSNNDGSSVADTF